MVLIVLRQLEVAGSNQQMAKLVRVLCLSSGSAKSFHEKAGECQVCSFIFSLFFSSFFFLLCSNCSPGVKPPLSPPFHPHSFFERLSLGASWVYSIQQVLLPDNRPLFPLAKETGPGLSSGAGFQCGTLATYPTGLSKRLCCAHGSGEIRSPAVCH